MTKKFVIRSINNSDQSLCVDIFKRNDNTFGFEEYRMKRYLPDGKDQFRNHVDVIDYNTARRFLVFFLYLNEPEGGETEFHCFNGEKIKPKAGRMCMFPPMWTHLHSGNAVMGTKPKYIIGSYLHYV